MRDLLSMTVLVEGKASLKARKFFGQIALNISISHQARHVRIHCGRRAGFEPGTRVGVRGITVQKELGGKASVAPLRRIVHTRLRARGSGAPWSRFSSQRSNSTAPLGRG